MGSSQSDTSIQRVGSPSGTLVTQTASESLTRAFDLLIASRTFSRSGQLKRLLAYLRNASEAADPGAWSETCIGATVFGRQDFNPKLDTIVRVEMRRLRRKLDEFYAAEGAALPFRLRLEKNAYKPYLHANAPSPPEPPAAEIVAAKSASRFRIGYAYGAGWTVLLMLLAAGLIGWLLPVVSANAGRREVAESPLWNGFRNRNVAVALGTPLFFRSGDGFERDFRMNLPDDLSVADRLLLRGPASPKWTFWAPFDDVGAAVRLDRFLRDMNSTATVVSARQLSVGGLAGQRTIVLGQPRTAPLLIDLLGDQNFRAPLHATGEIFGGIVNLKPRPGEPGVYSFRAGSAPQAYGMLESDESSPDYALVTSIRLANGGEVLSVFGNRSPTEAYLITKLIDPVFVSELDGRVFGRGAASYQSAQIVLRVDYHRGAPTGLVYLTHRLRVP